MIKAVAATVPQTFETSAWHHHRHQLAHHDGLLHHRLHHHRLLHDGLHHDGLHHPRLLAGLLLDLDPELTLDTLRAEVGGQTVATAAALKQPRST